MENNENQKYIKLYIKHSLEPIKKVPDYMAQSRITSGAFLSKKQFINDKNECEIKKLEVIMEQIIVRIPQCPKRQLRLTDENRLEINTNLMESDIILNVYESELYGRKK